LKLMGFEGDQKDAGVPRPDPNLSNLVRR